MTSQRLLTWDDSVLLFGDHIGEEDYRVQVRVGTYLKSHHGEEGDYFTVWIDGILVGELHGNFVRIWPWVPHQFTNRMRNRLNDLLQPLGWKVSIRGDRLIATAWESATSVDMFRGQRFSPTRNSMMGRRYPNASLLNN